ncbi:TlpA disulfide reductase family protein [soil metagenome]
MRRVLLVGLVAVLALAGCTADPLAEQYQDGSGQGYISGDGAYTEIEPADRDDPIEFSGTDENGDTISSEALAGEVFVVNFWYAGCPPCRTEAPDLAALATEYTDVPFVGVNTIDTVENATTFATKFGIPYPSIIDATTASVQLAFAGAGAVAPNAVPTTLVMDREGRVAARISGLIRDKSILASMIDRVVAEEN